MLMQNNHLIRWLSIVSISVCLSGCLGGDELNTETATYTPEARPLGILASDDIEVKPGEMFTISSRLVGTVTGQSMRWEQTSGPSVEIVDPTADALSITVPSTLLSANLVFTVYALNADGTNATDADGNILMDTVSVSVFDPESVIVIDVTDAAATLNGVALVSQGSERFIVGANNGSHTNDLEPGMSVIFNIDDQAGAYTLNLRYAIPTDYGGKVGGVEVNGIGYEVNLNATGTWEELRVGVIELVDGANTIEVGGGWNYYRIDGIFLIPSSEPVPPKPVEPVLVNPNASQAAKDLIAFLGENYLTATLSGQTEFPHSEGGTFPMIETQKIIDATGDDAPAIVAFDLMNYSSAYNGNDFEGLTEAIIRHHIEQNIIVSVLWHWRAPGGNGTFYSDATFDLPTALSDTNSTEHQMLMADMDIIAAELQKLEDANIPVLWRPVHEAEGGWFWWGAHGADTFKALWQLMYTHFTETHGLDNLIWTFTHAASISADWYPGDSLVDVVGYDGYAEPRNDATATFVGQYNTLKDRHDGVKLVALTETGTIPNVDLMHEQSALWSFFITWNSEVWDSESVIGPQGANPADIDAFYASALVLNNADVPGGRVQVSGVYANFEAATYGWEAQVNWSPTDGLFATDEWATSGAMSLRVTKDLSTFETADNVIFQVYPSTGEAVDGMTSLNIYVAADNAGTNVNAHIFFKAGENDAIQSWPEAVMLQPGVNMISTSLSELPDGTPIEVASLNGFGVRFQGMDPTATAATFYLDRVEAVDADGNATILYDFEPMLGPWHGQINWGTTTGATLSSEWAHSGGQSFALYKDLTQYDAVENAVLQAYPEGGIAVAGYSSLKVYANSIDAGVAGNAHIFYKAGDGDAYQSWPAATALVEGGTQLVIDLTDQVDADGNPVTLTSLNGMGVRFQGMDGASTNAKFMIDAITGVTSDGEESVLYDFESTGEFELQINWSPAPGLQLSNQWAANGGMRSLAGFTSINDGDEVILQTYPSAGILLADGVETLTLTAYVENASDSVTAKLWAKDQDGVWRDAGAISMTSDGAVLSLDISDLNELQGFGVQFQGLSSAQSKFFIDDIVFE